MAESMETGLVLNATEKVSSRLGAGEGTVYHSDRGCQYTSGAMRNWLRECEITQSTSAKGYCYDNATCESFFATLKREAFPPNCVFATKADARRTIFEYIETFYTPTRIHTSRGNHSPDQFLKKYFNPETITLN